MPDGFDIQKKNGVKIVEKELTPEEEALDLVTKAFKIMVSNQFPAEKVKTIIKDATMVAMMEILEEGLKKGGL